MSDTQAIAVLSAQVMRLTEAVTVLCQSQGARISRQQLAERLGVHRNTIGNYLERDRAFPRPGRDGKFALADVITWEIRAKES